VVGGLTNYRYELTFVALPLMLTALAVVPVSDREHRVSGRKAKWLMGGAYVVGFVPVLVSNRMMLKNVCASGSCYQGVRPALDPVMFKTFAVNIISSVPGTGGRTISQLLRAQGVSTRGIWSPTLWSVLAALVLLAVLAGAWWGTRPEQAEVAPEPDPEGAHAQAVLCAVSAALLILGGLGAAGVTSVSVGAQERMSHIGLLYRHSFTTWFGLAFGLVMLVLALGLWRPRLAVPSFVALGIVLALLVTVKVPTDARIMVANTALMKPTNQVFAEVVRGDKGAAANRRRCRILRDVDREMSDFYAKEVRHTSNLAFEHLWDIRFCVPT
jgi:hypothetical protein